MKEKTGHLAPFGLRMPPHIRKWVSGQARDQDRSMNYIILGAIAERMGAAAGGEIGVQAPAAAETTGALTSASTSTRY